MLAPTETTDPTCALGACAKPVHCRGLCRSHYTRWRRQGSPPDLAAWMARDGRELRACSECGQEFAANRNLTTCSADCLTAKRRRIWRENYHALPAEKKQEMVERDKQRRRDDHEGWRNLTVDAGEAFE